VKSAIMSYFPRAARVFVVLALASSAIAWPTLTAATAASPKPTTARAKVVPAQHRTARAKALALRKASLRVDRKVPKRASIVFDKNQKSPFNSRVYFRVWAKSGKKWVPIEASSWRAGSGLGGRAGKDSCHRNVGWLPDGSYSFVQHDHRKAPAINGRVFELQSKACHNGTVRQLLFIHSEQTQFNTQCRNRRGDDRCRWEVPVYNDYRSNGCIKMAPGPLRQLTRHFHRYFKAEVHYPTSVVKVRVVE
jgi:hypothetical protein